MKNNEFKLDAEDVALVIKKDMSTELYLPNLPDDVKLDPNDNQNVFVLIAINLAMRDQKFTEMISEKMDIIFATADMVSEEEEGKGCSPTACGECPGCGSFPKLDDDHDVNGHLKK